MGLIRLFLYDRPIPFRCFVAELVMVMALVGLAIGTIATTLLEALRQ